MIPTGREMLATEQLRRKGTSDQRVLVVEIKRFIDRYQLLVATAVVTSADRVPVACCQSVRMRSGAV